ncbi:MAG: 50S ribosomal protein L3 [Candidatus Kerfeldbacteria bacterium]|nr:50S ribosomal protein L3 [Candidatus Kerfeldbacteria bacterium]
MKKFLIATKREMTQRYRDDGTVQPVTVLAAGPCVVTAVRTAEKNGVTAVELGMGTAKRAAKAQRTAQQKIGGPFRHVRSFRVDDVSGFEPGNKLDVGVFAIGDRIKVVGTSKGRGFQGVVRRHHFHGSPATHGHKDQLRKSGSIGSTGPQRVLKGTRMAGRMGNERVTVRNLVIVEIRPETHELLVKGAVPGPRNALVLVESI